VGFQGGAPIALERLARVVTARFPSLGVAYASSPPFRPLTAEERARVVAEMNAFGARAVHATEVEIVAMGRNARTAVNRVATERWAERGSRYRLRSIAQRLDQEPAGGSRAQDAGAREDQGRDEILIVILH
jgi:hypothetical protein